MLEKVYIPRLLVSNTNLNELIRSTIFLESRATFKVIF